MIKLAVGARSETALGSLTNASREAENAQGAGGYASDRYHRYVEWAAEQVHLLSSAIRNEEIERLIATKRYSTLLSLDPASVSTVALGRLVDGELSQCIKRLEAARARIIEEQVRWDHGNAVAVVLDTNVWLKHFDDPVGAKWNQVLGERPDVPLVLTVPMKVVDELDGHKRNRADGRRGGLPIRRRAGKALKFLEAHADVPGQRVRLKEGTIASQPGSSTVYLAVLEQPLDQPPIPDADLEIIERASSISPYAKRVRLVTTDYGMVYRARQAGLHVTRIKDYEEGQEDPSS